MAWHHIIVSIEGEPSASTYEIAQNIVELGRNRFKRMKVEYQGLEGELHTAMVAADLPYGGRPPYI